MEIPSQDTNASTKDEPSGPGSGYKYWAFISYSHRDEKWARWLHTGLETYKIPRQITGHLAASTSPHGATRLYPVFRDRDELDGGFDLAERLRSALERSRFLIVICSPDSAQSRHVQQEIEVFEGLGREERVLCLIVGGEPGVDEGSAIRAQECLSPPLRTRRTPQGELVPCDPLAADVRKGKDGKTNAKLKLIAAMLGVGFDDLRRREDQRRFWWRLRTAATTVAAILVLAGCFLVALDAGLAAPGGERFRHWLDRHHLSVMRPVPDEGMIRARAETLRGKLAARLLESRARVGSDRFPIAFDENLTDTWAHNMAAFAVVNQPQGTADSRTAAPKVAGQFASDDRGQFGSMSIPEFWGLAGAARGYAAATPKGVPGGQAPTTVDVLTRTLDRFRLSSEPGGWMMYLTQPQHEKADAYSAVMALMALLEAKRAQLPWAGSVEQRDALLHSTFDWLVSHFTAGASPPGWQAGGTSFGESSDGLTLQIYGRLLDAEREAGLVLPPAILEAIPPHLERMLGREANFPNSSGEFSTQFEENGKTRSVGESINFLWYPWAIDCAVRWLQRDASGRPREERVAVQRALGHLVLDLGDQFVSEATKKWTFSASETLYGQSSIR